MRLKLKRFGRAGRGHFRVDFFREKGIKYRLKRLTIFGISASTFCSKKDKTENVLELPTREIDNFNQKRFARGLIHASLFTTLLTENGVPDNDRPL